MELSSSDKERIQHQYDALAKKTLVGEAKSHRRTLAKRATREVPFSDLSESELAQLFTTDEYKSDYFRFQVSGFDVLVKNELLAEALNALPERKRDIILLSYFLDMSDAEYGYIPDPNNRHHLIPDPETAPIVKQVFAMFVSGVRMCEIQKWLAENKVLTIGALRYQRTGQARYQRAMIAPYTWPDKTLYDILARQEYLGHTITAKTHKVSYKSKKTRKNEEEQRYFFPNTHEPLVDEETFELAQKRIATRHRPTKAAEIDIFSGLLFCAGCRHKMYYQQGVNIEPRKFSYSCGAWRNRARTGSECTSHYIRKNVLLDLVLEDMRRVLQYVKEHEQDFICKATEYGDMEARKALAQQQKELFKAQARMTELDTLFRKLYEDNALGRLTDERFVFLTSGYEDEKKSLAARIDELQQQIATVTERKRDISRFIQIVGKYSDIQELTYENVHEFIDRILIHELDRETNTRKIEIHYSFVGQVDTEQEPTQVVNHDRRNMVDVKSIAI